eukprot:gnl/TRDRNA2_/TRDRNA2_175594_c0_seq2.p1 gnl/TRDRNA2_/TRDRNA2_175594_c0~~gnl/TRDRNA2_/TRDRNA2_175594_c0_seq2.p1  ORF type:complete len:445 (+),score=71.78 gnl/TRDRNA2_/TRDRNA2_175594_c0_seq2:182-1516(+)
MAKTIVLLGGHDPQNIANALWAHGTSAMGTRAVPGMLAERASCGVVTLMPQELSNSRRPLVRTGTVKPSVMVAAVAGSPRDVNRLSLQDKTNIPWSFANLQLHNEPLLDAIAAEALASMRVFGQPLSAPMFLWAAWKGSLPDVALHLFDMWSQSDLFSQPEPFGLLLMDNDWWKDVGWELDILDRLHRVLPLRSVQLSIRRMGLAPSAPLASVNFGLQKIGRLVDDVEAAVRPGDPRSILVECERFAKHKGQWLKVAGLDKAKILELGLAHRQLLEHEIAAEFGVFVGYTAVRLAMLTSENSRRSVGVLSLEVSPVHVCVARHMLDLAMLTHVGEVKTGQAKDALPLLGEELSGSSGVGFAFMDHRGTIFHQDFALLESYALFATGARFVADNTLNPGSPIFLWDRAQCAPRETTAYSLTEFLADHEDWTAITDRDRESLLPHQ